MSAATPIIQTAAPSAGDAGHVTAAHSNEHIEVSIMSQIEPNALIVLLEAISQHRPVNGIIQTVTFR